MAIDQVFAGRIHIPDERTDLIMTIDSEEAFGRERKIYAGKLWGRLRGRSFKTEYWTTLNLHEQEAPNFDRFIADLAAEAQRDHYAEVKAAGDYLIMEDEVHKMQQASGL